MARRKNAAPKNKVYKRGGSLKKANYGTGRLRKAGWGQDFQDWTSRAVDNVGGYIGNVARDLTDPIVGGIDWFGDADRSWVPGTKDLWNIRPDDYSYQGRGWNKPGWKAGNRPAPAPDNRQKNVVDADRRLSNREKWAAEESYVPQSQRRSRGGVAKKAMGGHIVTGKFLRQGPKR